MAVSKQSRKGCSPRFSRRIKLDKPLARKLRFEGMEERRLLAITLYDPSLKTQVVAEIDNPVDVAVAPTGSSLADPAGPTAYVASLISGQEPGQPDKIYQISPDDSVASFSDLLPEADPIDLAFPPSGSSFPDQLYVAANNRDGGLPNDCGGAVQSIASSGAWSDFTSLTSTIPCSGDFATAITEPSGIAFSQAPTSFGDTLVVSNSDDEPFSIARVSPNGVASPLLQANLRPLSVAFSSNPAYGDKLYFQDAMTTSIMTYDASGTISLFAPLYGRSLTFAPGGLFGTDLFISQGDSVSRLLPDGTVVPFATGFNVVGGLAFSPDGSSLFITDFAADVVYRVESAYPKPEQHDISATAAWNNEAGGPGGINLKSSVVSGEFSGFVTWIVAWADSGGQVLEAFSISAPIGETNIPASNLGVPPAGAIQVVATIQLEDANSGNNVASVAWDPGLTVLASIDGNADENVAGRYFKGVDIPGLKMTVELSQSLAAMGATLQASHPATGAALTFAAYGPSNQTYEIAESELQPELDFANPTLFTVQAAAFGGTYNDTITIDTIKLPKWLGHSEASYTQSGYRFEKQYVDIDFTTEFELLDNSSGGSFWFGEGLKSGATANAMLATTATLDPISNPTVTGVAQIQVVFLDNVLFSEDLSLSEADGLEVSLDPRTLKVSELAVGYSENGSFTSPFASEGAKFDLNNVIELHPRISVANGGYIDYNVQIDVAIDDDGHVIDERTSVGFEFSSSLEGKLDIIPFKTPANLNPNKVRGYFNAFGLVWDILTLDVEGLISRTLLPQYDIFPTLSIRNSFSAGVGLKGLWTLSDPNPEFSGKIEVTDSSTSITIDWGDVLKYLFSEESEIVSFPNGLEGCYAFGVGFACPIASSLMASPLLENESFTQQFVGDVGTVLAGDLNEDRVIDLVDFNLLKALHLQSAGVTAQEEFAVAAVFASLIGDGEEDE